MYENRKRIEIGNFRITSLEMHSSKKCNVKLYAKIASEKEF